ncbi:MAG: cytochrome d ubiquinol oxidase subunit II [Marinilabiliales bacterium]|nr:MAG: cytochrome d ubiquinol oxidase subunit II [Marinilabiliales bacterium]
MFENLSLLALQQYWWFIVSLLAALLVFLMFVQGGQTFLFNFAKSDEEKSLMVNTLGRKWELTFTTLVTFGGAFFASFPLFYSTSFGGAYWVWMAILFSFIIQAVAYEFRSKPKNFFGAKTYEAFLFANGLLGTILIGTAVGTFFTGSNFSVDTVTNFSQWEHPAFGLEAVLNFRNVALGLAVFFLARILGLQFFINSIDDCMIVDRSRKSIFANALPFLIFFLYFAITLLIQPGYAYDSETGVVSMESFKYLHNFLAMPIVAALFLIGVVAVLGGIVWGMMDNNRYSFWATAGGTVFTVLALFLVAGLNNTSFYPSNFDLQSSLTIENSSSSKYTLTVMSYVSLLVPFVVAYIYYVWRSMGKKRIDKDELNEDIHIY